jgi:transcriptional regulator
MSKRTNASESDPVVRELCDVKKLLILDLLSRGVKQAQIAKMLGVDKGNFSRMHPLRAILGKPKKSE